MADKHRPIASRAELDQLIAGRNNDPAIPAHNHPRPNWVLDADDSNRVHMRMRERRIRYIENRLKGAQKTMERDFDQSS